ncbi:MAG: ORF6N domain-containing protein [Cecembia sp.]
MEPMKVNIESYIYTVRGVQVMLDYPLAMIYHVETKRLNEQVKRNMKRFPGTFMFKLTQEEWDTLQLHLSNMISSESLQSQFATAKRRTLPYAFTEQGVSMLSAVLNSDTAIEVSIQIMQAFVALRKTLINLHGIIQRLEGVELKQLQTDSKLEQIFQALDIV